MFSCGLYCFTGCDSVLYDVPVCESRFHYSTLPCALSHYIPCYVMFLISACSIPQIYFFIFCTLYHVLLYLSMLCYAMFYRITPYYGASYCSVIHHVILCFTMFFLLWSIAAHIHLVRHFKILEFMSFYCTVSWDMYICVHTYVRVLCFSVYAKYMILRLFVVEWHIKFYHSM